MSWGLEPWKWADRQQTWLQNQRVASDAEAAVTPYVQAGDYDGAKQALGAVTEVAPDAPQQPRNSLLESVGRSLAESNFGVGSSLPPRPDYSSPQYDSLDTMSPDERPSLLRRPDPGYTAEAGPQYLANRTIITSGSGNETLKAISGGHLSYEGLPDWLYTPLDVATAPLTLATLGSTGGSGTTLRSVGLSVAKRLGLEVASAEVGMKAGEKTYENLPEGTPEPLAQALAAGVGIAAGGGSYAALQNPKATARALQYDPSKPAWHPARWASLGAITYKVDPLGTAGIDESLAREGAVYQHPRVSTLEAPSPAGFPGAGGQAEKTGLGWLAGKVASMWDPSRNQTETVNIAQRAAAHTRTGELQSMSTALNPVVRDLKTAIATEAPDYIGPAPTTFGQKALIGTEVDIVERPWAYRVSDELKAKVSGYSQAVWDSTGNRLRTGFNHEVAPIEPPNGGGYVTHAVAKEALEDKVTSAASQIGSNASKERAWPTLFERAGDKNWADTPFVTDLAEATAIHTEAAARTAAKAVLREATGGLTLSELKEAMNPELFLAKKGLHNLLDSLEGRVKTARARWEARDAENAIFQKQLLAARDKQNGLFHAIGAQMTTGEQRRAAAMEALANTRATLTEARNEALAAAKEAGAAGTPGKYKAALERYLKKADALGAKYASAADEEVAQRAAGGQIAGPARGMTRAELKQYWTEVHQLRQNIHDAVSAQRDAMAEIGHLPVGKAAAAAERADNALLTTREGRLRLKAAEAEAIRAAQAAGESADDPALSYLNGRLRSVREEFQRMATKTTKSANRRGQQDQLIAGLQQAIDDVQIRYDEAAKRWRAYDPTRGGQDFASPASTPGYYYPPKIAKDIEKMGRTTGGLSGLFDFVDEIRAIRYSQDGSPITQQAGLGLSANNPVTNFRDTVAAVAHPTTTVRRAQAWLSANPELEMERLAQMYPREAEEYSYFMGRPLLRPTSAEEGWGGGRGLMRPTIGGRNNPLAKPLTAAEEKLWSVSQVKSFSMFRDYMDENLAAGASRYQAAADAAKTVQSIIPMQDIAMRGLSPMRASVERGLATSVAFMTAPPRLIANATVGMTKLAAANTVAKGSAWAQLSNTERIAVRRSINMAGNLGTLSLASAIASADSRGMNPIEAIKEALNPDSRYFLALQLGEGRSIPLGGPFRSFIKALLPGNPVGEGGLDSAIQRPFDNLAGLLRSKAAPIPAYVSDITVNSDFFGNPVRGEGPLTRPQNLLRALWYASESVLPLGMGGQVAADLRTGEHENAWALARSVAAGLAGTNYGDPSPTEKLSQFSRNWPGNEGRDYWDSSPKVKAEIQEAHPDVWQQYLSRAKDETKKYNLIREDLKRQQFSDDGKLATGQLSMQDWISGTDDRRQRLLGAEQALFSAEGKTTGSNKLEPYYQKIKDSTENGRVNWEAVNTWLVNQPKEFQDYVAENTGLTRTPLQKLRMELQREYYALPRYVGLSSDEAYRIDTIKAQVDNEAGRGATPAARLGALRKIMEREPIDEATASKVRLLILGALTQSKERETWLRQHPEGALVTGRSKLSPAQIAAIEEALPGPK